MEGLLEPSCRFVDLFSGSGVVSYFAATSCSAEVTSVDLENFAVVLARSVVSRTRPISAEVLISEWLAPSLKQASSAYYDVHGWTVPPGELCHPDVIEARRVCSSSSDDFVRSYGGFYFSPYQAWCIGWLRRHLPDEEVVSDVCLASLIMGASDCCASPGHTAQPFGIGSKGLKYIDCSWRRDLGHYIARALRKIGPLHAEIAGTAVRGDALEFAQSLRGDEIVFLDPPYSDVQYSRFYHVLEGIACGGYSEVYGSGRMPSIDFRQQSAFSRKSSSFAAMETLIGILGRVGCKVVVTFPQENASNGLSSTLIESLAEQYYYVDSSYIPWSSSTLGGAKSGRGGRIVKNEAMMLLMPRG